MNYLNFDPGLCCPDLCPNIPYNNLNIIDYIIEYNVDEYHIDLALNNIKNVVIGIIFLVWFLTL